MEHTRPPARPATIIYDGVLGASFLQDRILTIDLASNPAWTASASKR